jgi:hypothetical protein
MRMESSVLINIYLTDPDLVGKIENPHDLIIKNQSEYIKAYSEISSHLYSNQNFSVVCTDNIVNRWLKVMANRYGSQLINLTEVSIRSHLSKKIGLPIPDKYSDKELKNSELLDINNPAGQGVSFEDFIIETYFGDFLTISNNFRRVGDFAVKYEKEQWQAAIQRPLIHNIYKQKLNELKDKFRTKKSYGDLKLIEWLEDSPELLLRNLVIVRLMQTYPEEIGTRVLGKAYPDIRKLHLDLRNVPINLAGIDGAIDEIRLYLRGKTDKLNPHDFLSLLEDVSGFLEIEFDLLIRVVNIGVIEVNDNLIRKIRSKFIFLNNSPSIAQSLSNLDLMITKSAPSLPESSWNENEWIDWAINQYFPYRFWLENTGQLDDHIGELASLYADWLYKNYGDLLYHSDQMAWKFVFNLGHQIKSNSEPVLIVIVDNLNAKFYPELKHHLEKNRFYEDSLAYGISMLPSCTEVGKKCLMTGHFSPFTGTGYAKHVEKIWGERLNKNIKYIPNIGAIREINNREHDVYFLNYLPLDIILHQSEKKTGLSHSQAIRSSVASLADDILSFSRRIGAERNLKVVITSDHGSTLIPKGTVNVLKGNYYKNKAIDKHHRYLALSDGEINDLPENVQYDCYIFEKGVFDINTNYLVARRLYRFLETDEDSYVHGGLTPEETLVPLAIFRPITISPKPISIKVMSSRMLYKGTKQDIVLEFTNLNNYPCSNVHFEFDESKISGEIKILESIPKLHRGEIAIPVRVKKIANEADSQLRLEVSFTFMGKHWENTINLPIQIIEPAKPKFSLDDL